MILHFRGKMCFQPLFGDFFKVGAISLCGAFLHCCCSLGTGRMIKRFLKRTQEYYIIVM